jgi:hypothetical protein
MSNKLTLKSNLDIEEPTAVCTERILSTKLEQNILQEDDINRHLERIHDFSSPEIKSTTKNEPENFYLVECIKLHQASIKEVSFFTEKLHIYFKDNISTNFKTNILERKAH